MTELEKLKQQLNEISEKVKQLENPNLDTNKWYFYENKILLYIEKFNNIDITGKKYILWLEYLKTIHLN